MLVTVNIYYINITREKNYYLWQVSKESKASGCTLRYIEHLL